MVPFPDDFRTGFHDIHNSGRQAASVTHFGSHFAHLNHILDPIGGAGSSKVVVSYKRGIKIATSQFLVNFELGRAKRSSKLRPSPPKGTKVNTKMSPNPSKCCPGGPRSLHFEFICVYFSHFEGPLPRRVLKELAGHLRPSTFHKNEPIMWHHLVTMVEKVSSDGSATSLNSKPLGNPHKPFRPIHFTV